MVTVAYRLRGICAQDHRIPVTAPPRDYAEETGYLAAVLEDLAQDSAIARRWLRNYRATFGISAPSMLDEREAGDA